jgi:putative chitinase
MEITADIIKSLYPQYKHPDDLAEVLTEQFEKYEINTVNRAAGFLAQCGHESNGFTVLKENLNYSAEGLTKIFHKYFPDLASATPYARQPQKIANKVYANRMGNGPESSGDGFKYCGRGAIQLTGHDNYAAFAKSVGMTIDEAVHDLETLDGAIESACWFWKKNGLNAICDNDDIVLMTKRINGGTIGLDDRKKHYEHAKELLG